MAVTIQNYNQFLEILGDGTLDMDTHSFKAALMTSGFTFNAANTIWANVSANELAGGNGYTTGGLTLTSVTWTETSGEVTFNFADLEWEATGGSLTGITDMVMYDDTVSGDPLMFAVDLGGSFTIVDGARIIFQVGTPGFFRILKA